MSAVETQTRKKVKFSTTRGYYGKLLAATLVFLIIAKVWGLAPEWRPYFWIFAAVCFVFLIVPAAGRPLHNLWNYYLERSSQGSRFFLGTALIVLLIAWYRFFYISVGASTERLMEVPYEALSGYRPAGDYLYWLLAGLVAGGVSFSAPASSWLFDLWMKLAHLIQAVMGRVLLTLVYLIGVVPLGLLAQLTGKRFLLRELDPDAASYWIDRDEKEFTEKHYGRHF